MLICEICAPSEPRISCVFSPPLLDPRAPVRARLVGVAAQRVSPLTPRGDRREGEAIDETYVADVPLPGWLALDIGDLDAPF